MDALKRAGAPEDEMAALERQLAPSVNDDSSRKVGFVSAGVETRNGETGNDAIQGATDNDNIELPEDDDSNEDEVEIAQKAVPASVFGDLASKVDIDKDIENKRKENGDSAPMGALERIKRLRRE